MRRDIRQVDWVRLIPIVLILVALIAINIYRRTGEPEPQSIGVRYTSYSAEKRGAKALYLLLEKLGYESKRLRAPHFSGIGADGLAVILAPDRLPISEMETERLLEWIERGNTLLFAPGRSDSRLAKSLGVKLHQRPARKAFITPVASTELTVGVAGVSVLSGDRIITGRNDIVRHFGDSVGVVVASVTAGAGTAIVISDPYIMTNGGLPEAGNLDLLVNILLSHTSDAKTVYFDEYHHGFRRQPGVLQLLRGTSLGWALLQVALAVILLMISRARRFGQPKLVLRESHRSSLEYVTSLAGIYQSARAPDQALASLYNSLTYSVRGRPSGVGVREVMDECRMKMSGGNISERELIDLSRRMELARRPKGGK